jgi:penicillin-binding protein 2
MREQPATDSPISDRERKLRARALGYVVAGAFLVLLARLWFLQIARGAELERAAVGTRARVIRTDPPRGLIVDRHGQILATSQPSYAVSFIGDDAALAGLLPMLSRTLGLKEAEIERRVRENRVAEYRPVLIAEDVDLTTIARVEERRLYLPGVDVIPISLRRYPNATLAAHILGYVGQVSPSELRGEESPYKAGDIVGKTGIEKSADAKLRGTAGERTVEVDVVGNFVRLISESRPVPGGDVWLTIDAALQRATQDALGSRAGSVVAIDPRSGEILALASSPTFDPNLFVPRISPADWGRISQDKRHPLHNRAIQSRYPCGSVFKIVTATAALETHNATPQTTWTCPGYYKVGRRTFRCWKAHGTVGFIRAVAESCDAYFYEMGMRVGVETLGRYAKGFGLGSKTGIDIPGEVSGLIPTPEWKLEKIGERWYGGDTANMAIGQGYVQVTPLQMAVVVSAVANGGRIVRPHLELDEKGDHVVGRAPMSEATRLAIARGMVEAVNTRGGTARSAAVPGVVVAGKTGTAEDPPRARPHSWFVCFAPASSPEIALCVMLEQAGHGADVAAPIGRKILASYFGSN